MIVDLFEPINIIIGVNLMLIFAYKLIDVELGNYGEKVLIVRKVDVDEGFL